MKGKQITGDVGATPFVSQDQATDRETYSKMSNLGFSVSQTFGINSKICSFGICSGLRKEPTVSRGPVATEMEQTSLHFYMPSCPFFHLWLSSATLTIGLLVISPGFISCLSTIRKKNWKQRAEKKKQMKITLAGKKKVKQCKCAPML